MSSLLAKFKKKVYTFLYDKYKQLYDSIYFLQKVILASFDDSSQFIKT
jgi:hypothetical protein